MRRIALTLLVVLLCPFTIHAAGFAHSDNFIVYTPGDFGRAASQQYADDVLEHAERCRKAIAEEWFGEEIPDGIGRAVINVAFADGEDSALTWAIDDAKRTMHNVYLRTSPEAALGATLHHEIAHVVFATWYPHPNRLPAWLEEGIASCYDDPQRIVARHQIMRWAQRTGNWPKLAEVLSKAKISASDKATYAAAASLTSYLLTRGDKGTLMRFAQEGNRKGLDAALQQHYRITDTQALQTAWQTWASQKNAVAARN